jgi:hypothetical protein
MGHIPIGRNNHRCSSQQAPRVTIVHTNQPNLQLTRDMAQLNEKTNLMANELQNQKNILQNQDGVLENISNNIQYIIKILRNFKCGC